MFEFAFDSMAAFQQVGMFIAALILLGIGGLLLGNELYWQLRATRVKGTVLGVRQKKGCYHPVYSYMLPTGESFESTSNTGSSLVKGKETNRTVSLLVFPQDPLNVQPANGILTLLCGLLFLAPGLFIGYVSFTRYPVTPLTFVMIGAMAFYGWLKFKKNIIPKEQREPTVADWKSKRRAERKKEMEALPIVQIETILASPERAAALELERKNGRFAAPFVFLFALGLLYGGYDHYTKLSELGQQGLRASGKVVDMRESHSSSGGSTYYPVVEFTDQKGNVVTFQTRAGSNPPMDEIGDSVKVLYLENDPKKTAAIDHGFWDRVVPWLIGAGGVLLLLLSLHMARKSYL